MKHGLKVGPQKRAFDDIDACKPQFVEVWYNAARPGDYDDLFAFMERRGTPAGLHFWATTTGGYFPTLTADEPVLVRESVALMRRTIDVAARHGHLYVNIHPGPRARVALDLDRMVFTAQSSPPDLAVSERIFLENASLLSAYARERNVVFTVETVPPNVAVAKRPNGSYDRTQTVAIHEAPLEFLEAAGRQGIAVANDFGHTGAAAYPQTRDTIMRKLYDVTKTLAPATRLIHLGFLVPPFNGTDVHDRLNNPVFKTTDAVPNESEMSTLLSMFKNRPDVWSLVEPDSDHAGNYRYGVALLESLGLLS